MNTDAQNFLASLTFAAGEESPIVDAPASDFHPDIVDAVTRFCQAFRERCAAIGLDPDAGERSFGGNVYFSLSGHGCGFWDDSGPWGDVLQAALENFAGSRHRFESLAENLDYEKRGKARGTIHLQFYAKFRKSYLEKYFGLPDLSTLPPFALNVAFCPDKGDVRTCNAGERFSPPPYWEGCTWTVQPFTPEYFETLLSTIA